MGLLKHIFYGLCLVASVNKNNFFDFVGHYAHSISQKQILSHDDSFDYIVINFFNKLLSELSEIFAWLRNDSNFFPDVAQSIFSASKKPFAPFQKWYDLASNDLKELLMVHDPFIGLFEIPDDLFQS